MNTFTLRRIVSSLMVLTLLATTQLVRAQSPEPAATPASAVAGAAGAASAAGTGAGAGTGAAEDPEWDERSEHHHAERHHYGSRQSHSDDLISVGHDSNLPSGRHADSVVSIFGSSTSDGDAEDVVSVFGDTRVTGTVNDSAVSVFGSTYIDSKIEGNAVAVMGNLELGPHAEIGGDAVAVGGTLERDPAAIVHGEVQNVFTGNFGSFRGLRAWVQHCLLYGRPLAIAPGLGWAWTLAFTLLALYVGLALLFREGLFRCVETFEAQPGQTLLAALLTTLLTPVLVVLLCVTVIGIAAVPFVVAGLLCVSLFGKAVILAWLGRRLTGRHGSGVMSLPAVAVLIGGAVAMLLYLIPVLGFLVYKLLGFLGVGAVVYTLILAIRARQAGKHADHAAAAPHTGPIGGAINAATVSNVAPAPASVSSATAAPGPGSAFSASAAPGPGSAFTASSTPGPASTSDTASAPGLGSAPGTAPGPGGGSGFASSAASPAIAATLPRAGFWVRMAALLIDVLLIGFVTSVLHQVFHMHLLVLATYGAVMWKLRGSTIGGIVFDLRVVRLDGREVDWETAIVRALGCFLSLAVAGLGFFWIAFDDAKQAWHDKIAGTVVVRVAKGTPLV
jgi:uncharacterized RDD family membrane protein YckC